MEQWQRPRVGEQVELADGKIAEIIIVRKLRDILSAMDEIQAMRFSVNVQARYGKNWSKFYYQADVMLRGNIKTIEPNDIREIMPPD